MMTHFIQSYPRKVLRLFIITLGLSLNPCLQSPAHATDDWKYEAEWDQRFQSESNPLMLTQKQEALFGLITIPQFSILNKTPTSQFIAKTTLNKSIFNQSHFDSTDAHTNISANTSLEHWEAGINLQSDYDTTRTSELSTLNTNTVESVRHIGHLLSAKLAYTPNLPNQLSLDSSIQESRYSNPLFSDYHAFSLSPSFQHHINAVNTAKISFLIKHYQSNGTQASTAETLGPSIGWTTLLSPTLTANVLVGLQEYTQSTNANSTSSRQLESAYTADLSYKENNDLMILNTSRAAQPFINGNTLYLNTLGFVETHTINPRLSTKIALNYQFSGNNETSATNLKSLKNAMIAMSYHATNKVDITCSYQYREQTLSNIIGSQRDSLFFISLNYHSKVESGP
jgi:hypothetical protein